MKGRSRKYKGNSKNKTPIFYLNIITAYILTHEAEAEKRWKSSGAKSELYGGCRRISQSQFFFGTTMLDLTVLPQP
jgi:hypothetical protein